MKKSVFRILVYVLILSLILPGAHSSVRAEGDIPPTPTISTPKPEFTDFLPEKANHEHHLPSEPAYLPELAERFPGEGEITKPREYTPPSPEVIAQIQSQIENFTCSTITDVPQIECEALVALFKRSSGVSWYDNTNWLATNTVGNWYGVSVTGGHVTGLDLQCNWLLNTITSELGNLVHLESLNLSANMLTGSIPLSFTNLTSVKDVRLSLNQSLCEPATPEFLAWKSSIPTWYFNGPVCAEPISICSEVTDVPTSECEALVEFYNNTSGPEWSQNKWLQPPSVGDWEGIHVDDGHVIGISLYYPIILRGSIPPQIVNLSNLEGLRINWGSLIYSSIPPELGELSNLGSFYCQECGLYGLIPPELGNLSNLEHLDLEWNNLIGSIPRELGNMSSLNYLDLSINNLSGSIPSELSNLSNLSSLDLTYNDLTGSLPSELGNLSNLGILYLGNNLLSGSIPLSFVTLQGLHTFGFAKTLICEPNNPDFLAWKATVPTWYSTGIGCGDPEFSCSLVTDVPQIECETLVSLFNATDGMNWKDSMGWLLGKYVGNWSHVSVRDGHVYSLELFNNQLNGTIPPELDNLTKLITLSFSNNQLSGSIPKELGNLTELITLSLSSNQLSGVIPSELGSLVNLEKLFLSTNQFTGSIPLSFVDLTNLNGFVFKDTLLCEPQTPEFLAWKETVSWWEGTGIFCAPSDLPPILSVNLRVDDAPEGVVVNKSPNSYVDVVARVKADSAINMSVSLNVPSNLLGSPILTFTRDLANNSGYGQENEYEISGDGQYRVNTVLSNSPVYKIFYKEVVWRFSIPASTLPQYLSLEVDANYESGDVSVDSSDNVVLRITNQGNSLIVTDRQRLFNIHASSGNISPVVALLEETYKAAGDQNGEVFYVDNYGIDWFSSYDEEVINQTAETIDGLIETWYHQLTSTDKEPRYLVIIGGDDIIPFYRMDDNDYHDCFLIDHNHCEEDSPWHDNWLEKGYRVIGDAYEDNYFLSDNIYADVGGGKSSWEKGDLELSMGRIIGQNADDMSSLIIRGNSIPRFLNESLLASLAGLDVDYIVNKLNEFNIPIHSTSNPDLTENNEWTKAQFLEAWETDSQMFTYLGHANPKAMSAHNKDEIISPSELPSGETSGNNPLFLGMACNLVVPIDDGYLNRLIDLGFSGVIGSTGLASYSPPDNRHDYGEVLANGFVVSLFEYGNARTRSFGDALLNVKQNLNPPNYSGYGKKTALEFTLFGLPWNYFRLDGTSVAAIQDLQEITGFKIKDEVLVEKTLNSYSKIISISIPEYSFTSIDGFDLLEIDGTQLLTYDSGSPALPYIQYTIHLPPGSIVDSANLANETNIHLGVKNLPSMKPITTYDEGTGFFDFTGTGVYPATRLSYEVVDLPDSTAVEITLVLAEYNGTTQKLTLFNNTDIQINYTPNVPAFVNEIALDEYEFVSGEQITGSAEVINVSAAGLTLSGQLEIFNEDGLSLGTVVIPNFTLPESSSLPIPLVWTYVLPKGFYNAVFSLYQSDSVLSKLTGSFSVVNGQVTDFIVPEVLKQNQTGELTLSFANYLSAPVEVSAEVIVYYGTVEIDRLAAQTFIVQAGSESSTIFTWTPVLHLGGNYSFSPVVTVGEDHYFYRQTAILVPYETYVPLINR